jgi:hypothetical protein
MVSGFFEGSQGEVVDYCKPNRYKVWVQLKYAGRYEWLDYKDLEKL